MNARPKILMLTTQIGYGGSETSFIRLANYLHKTMEVTVALFTSDYGTEAYAKGHEPLQASLVLLDRPEACGRMMRWWHRISTFRKLKQKHDIAISFLSGPNLVNVLAGYDHCTVVSVRGSRVYDPVSPPWLRRIFQYLFDPLMFHLAARIVPISPGLSHEIGWIAGKHVLSKITVIPPFIDQQTTTEHLAEPIPPPYNKLVGQKVIVAVGRLSVEKGFHHLIRVFATLTKTVPEAKLLLVGDGPQQPTLHSLCDTLHLTTDDITPGIPSVIFAGYQKNPLPLVKLASVYAMTSATEGFSNVVLEAIAANVPVVAADTPWGVRSILSDRLAASPEPYPTTSITEAEYGLLLPRIDLAEYQNMWAEVLAAYLTGTRKPNPRASERVQDFELAKVGAMWNQLIQNFEAS